MQCYERRGGYLQCLSLARWSSEPKNEFFLAPKACGTQNVSIKKKNADLVLSSVKYHNFHLAVFEALAFGSSLEWLTSFQQRETCDPQGITTGFDAVPKHQTGAARLNQVIG